VLHVREGAEIRCAHRPGGLFCFLYSRHVSLCGIVLFLGYAPRRVICTLCGGVPVEAMTGGSGKRRCTRALMVTLATWAGY
jgi:hypothetical protein